MDVDRNSGVITYDGWIEKKIVPCVLCGEPVVVWESQDLVQDVASGKKHACKATGDVPAHFTTGHARNEPDGFFD